tara:strand:- start:272 stop:499 length:228 start_codon:yes stop_codon:yes gene_type:complete
MNTQELDEILTYRWPIVMRRAMGGTDEWVKGFARSIARHGKRAKWHPTAKQAQIMRKLVSELGSAPEEEIELIER